MTRRRRAHRGRFPPRARRAMPTARARACVRARIITHQTRPTHRRQRCARQHAHTHTPSVTRPTFVAHHASSSSSSSITARTVRDGIHGRARIAERVYRLAHARHRVVRARHVAHRRRRVTPRVESPWCAGVTIGQNTPSACTSARAVGARSRGVSARRGVRRRRPGAPHAFHARHTHPAPSRPRAERRRSVGLI